MNNYFSFVNKINIQPRRGCGRPRRAPTDEKVALASHALSPYEEPEAPPKFQVLPMWQPDFFPSMTLEACLAYTNFWYG